MTVKGSTAISATGWLSPFAAYRKRHAADFSRHRSVLLIWIIPFDLTSFIGAQRGSYDQALAELRASEKRSHWMWSVFQQLAGLGTSAMAQHYAISGLDEARDYLRHPVLGDGLHTCTATVNAVTGRTAHQMFGSPGT